MKERRRFPRSPVHKRAKVLFDRDETPSDCIVFDLTSHGVGLQLAPDVRVSSLFELSFDNFRSARDCHLAWRNNERLGACFR